MKILLACNGCIPPLRYGGIERVVWWLGNSLEKMGHEVRYLAHDFSIQFSKKTVLLQDDIPIEKQIDDWADLVHFHFPFFGEIHCPYLNTIHGNGRPGTEFPINTVFLSKKQAGNHGSDTWVHNGLDPDEYGAFEANPRPDRFHFLGNAAWRLKNVKGAIRVSRKARVMLDVLGGSRLNIRMGFRFTPYRSVYFHGMVGGEEKLELIRKSSGLIFPVLWHEPFGLATIESLILGSPVFATPFGALSEIVAPEVGFLSTSVKDLADAVRNVGDFNRKHCRDYALENFSADRMASNYLKLYERVLNGEQLNASLPTATDTAREYFKLQK